jgi:hypothetical protein
MTTWQYARLIIHTVPVDDGIRAHYWRAILLDHDGQTIILGQFDAQSDPSQDSWKLNRWHLRMLNRAGRDGWELMHIQSHEGDYHYIFKRSDLSQRPDLNEWPEIAPS